MEELNRQVKRARRRLNFQKFLRTLVATLFVTLMVATVAIAIRKIWVITVDDRMWLWSWVGGGVAAGIAVAAGITYVRRFRSLEAAIELDRRFGLKERVSSSLALDAAEAETPIGQALLKDAVRRVERIEVSEQFRYQGSWWSLAPLVPAAAIFLLTVLVPDARTSRTANADTAQNRAQQPVRKSTEVLKKKVAERRKEAAEAGLEEAGELFERLEKGVEELAKKQEIDRKQALVELSDLAEDLKKRREEMEGSERLKDQLKQLNNLQRGPGDELARALKKGDMQKALDELKQLQEKLRNDSLTDEQKQQLAQQMQQMGDKLDELAKAHEKAKQDLQNEIARAKQAGDDAKAEQLQQQLDQLQMQDKQMQRMAQMAQQLQQGAQQMQDGNPAQASANLEEIAEMMQGMQQEMDELEMLDDALNEIAEAKNSMNCKQCMGDGCAMCQGGNFPGMAQRPGRGMGEGQGQGDRPEEKTDAGFYESRVRAEVQRGARGVVVGSANGPNVAGNVLEEVKAALESAAVEEADPLTGQRLPKSQRTQAQQYFDALRNAE